MEVIKIKPYFGEANTFAVTDDGKNCILIDCAHEGILKELKSLGLTPKGVLLTHGHFDHVGGCGEFTDPTVNIFCSKKEEKFIFSQQNRSVFGGVHIPDFTAHGILSEGGNYSFEGLDFKVIETPGHTAGSLCFIFGNNLFTGDTLFCQSVGRCDLPTGNSEELKKSLKKLCELEGDYKIYCGHFGETTLDNERKFNPYIKSLGL